MINDTKYWKERHITKKGYISAVGNKNYSNKANNYIYKILEERYLKLLKNLDIKKNTKILDAGSGIGILSKFLSKNGFTVTASDISKEALESIKDNKIQTICSSIENINLPASSFEISQCFDVLYHILNEKNWENSIANLCKLSNKYVILHERFLKRKPIISSKHINVRTYRTTKEMLEKYGYKEYMSTPTHFFVLRIFTYKISKYFPKMFYKIDKFTLNTLDKFKINTLGSHHIKVFRKMET